MHPFKKLLILVIILFTFYIIFNLLNSRQTIKLKMGEEQKLLKEDKMKEDKIEGFGPKDDENANMKSSFSPLSIQSSFPPTYLSLPIREFIVKSSYNSAISGQYAGKEPIMTVLERGCRLVDFEIYTRNNIEYVSYSEDPQYQSMDIENDTANQLSLGDAFNTVIGYAFTTPSPSPNDPLFVSLRIKNNSPEAYSRIATLIDFAFKKRLYEGEVNGETQLKDLIGKVIIILDKTSSPDYKNYIKCSSSNCYKLSDYVNMEAGTISFPKYTYTNLETLPQKVIMPSKNGLQTDITSFMMITPLQIDQIKPPNPVDTITKWHPQFLSYKFYKPSDELNAYENIFNQNQTSFVPVTTLILRERQKNSAVDNN